ncbi:hypothetical protein [Pectobacterium carotovorum]|uniref:hypothetical protein n=1 Tax=Pectobacterium carotovorum TaxID=554 RepID=UPI002B24147F|nr:hypothetical protein [Pectobacterium carotovorum]
MTEADLDELADEIVLLFTTGEFYRGIGSGIGEVSKNFGYLTTHFLIRIPDMHGHEKWKE